MRSAHSISDKPLDFSFLKMTEIAQLKKEPQRSGKRKPIHESEEEDDVKKVSYRFKPTHLQISFRTTMLLHNKSRQETRQPKMTPAK